MDEVEKAANEVSRTRGWVADAAVLLVASWKDGGERRRVEQGENVALVAADDFEELRTAVENWTQASQAFLDALARRDATEVIRG